MSIGIERAEKPQIDRAKAIQALLELLIPEPQQAATPASAELLAGYPDMLNVKEVAKICRISERAAHDFWLKKDFPGVRFGARKVVMKQDFIHYLDAHKGLRIELKED